MEIIINLCVLNLNLDLGFWIFIPFCYFESLLFNLLIVIFVFWFCYFIANLKENDWSQRITNQNITLYSFPYWLLLFFILLYAVWFIDYRLFLDYTIIRITYLCSSETIFIFWFWSKSISSDFTSVLYSDLEFIYIEFIEFYTIVGPRYRKTWRASQEQSYSIV